MRKIITIVCIGCGKSVTGRLQKRTQYCSKDCFYKNVEKCKPKTGKEVSCGLCGKSFYVRKSRADKSENYFCCPAHANEWQGRNKIHGKCKTCGKEFARSPSFIERGTNEFCSNKCRYASPEFTEHAIKMNVNQQRLYPNKLEKLGYSMLDETGVKYNAQHLIGGKFCVDAFIPEHGLIVQFDGDYWHGNPERFPNPTERQLKRMSMDKSQDAYMKACGYKVIRLWESMIKSNYEASLELIKSSLSNAG